MKIQYDSNKMREILQEFYNAFGVRVSFLRGLDEPIMGFPLKNCELCTYKQKNKEFYEQCKLDDKKAFEEGVVSNGFHMYECHYHLYECIQPIRINGQVFGYFLLGQILTDRKRFIELNHPNDEELDKLKQLKEVEKDKIKSYAKILSWIVKYCVYSHNIDVIHDLTYEHICSYISENYNKNISIKNLCDEFHYSKSTLHSLFKKEGNVSINQYLTDIRISKAKELICFHTAGEVAEMVGYSDINYFSRIFKKETGMSPTQYKKQKSQNK